MQFPHVILRNLFQLATVCAVVSCAGCGNSCFVGFSNNGNGGIIIRGGNPPPVCTLSQAQGMIRVTLATAPVCSHCGRVVPVQHLYVMLRGVQIQAEPRTEAESVSWLELAPELNIQPRRIDLIGDSGAELRLASSQVPTDKYPQLRLQFASEPQYADSKCEDVANCLVSADGGIESLQFASEPEVVLTAAADSGSLFVLPDSTTVLQLRLTLQSFEEVSAPGSQDVQARIVGEFRMFREDSMN